MRKLLLSVVLVSFAFGGGIRSEAASDYVLDELQDVTFANNGDLLASGILRGPQGSTPLVGIVRIEPGSASCTIVSSLTKEGLKQIHELAVGASGQIYAVMRMRPERPAWLLAIDPMTGAQETIFTVSSDVPDAFVDIVLDESGSILATECVKVPSAMGCTGRILRIDPATGEQKVLFSDNKLRLTSLAIDDSGHLFVINSGLTPWRGSATPRILRIDPVSGQYSVVPSNMELQKPHGLAIAEDGNPLVGVGWVPGRVGGGIYKIDRDNGSYTLLVAHNTPQPGVALFEPRALAVSETREIFAIYKTFASHAARRDGGIFRIHPETYTPTLIVRAGEHICKAAE